MLTEIKIGDRLKHTINGWEDVVDKKWNKGKVHLKNKGWKRTTNLILADMPK
jgi:hypothetical protein